MQHASHPAILKRLKRVEGHVRSVIAMMEAGRPCLDLAQQLHAIEAAVASAKRELIHDHIEHCLEGGETSRSDLAEIKQLTKYL
jgi:DNA-binding FrmR family transcriptional regulator